MNRDFKFKILYPIIVGISAIILLLLLNNSWFDKQIENSILILKYFFSSTEIEEEETREGIKVTSEGIESDIMILAIDEESVGLTQILGKFPWPRSVYGQIISYFDVNYDLLTEFDELIKEADQAINELEPQVIEIEEKWENISELSLIGELNLEAMSHLSNNDSVLYNELEEKNLSLISILTETEIIEDVKKLNGLIINKLEPQKIDITEYYKRLNEFIKELEYYLNTVVEENNRKINSSDIEENEKTKLQYQNENTKQTLTYLEKFYSIITKYIEYLNSNNNENSLSEIKSDLENYISDELKIENPEEIFINKKVSITKENQNIKEKNNTEPNEEQPEDETDTETEIEDEIDNNSLAEQNLTEKEKIKAYINFIKSKNAELLGELNNQALSFYSKNNEEHYEKLNSINLNIKTLLLKNDENIIVLGNTKTVNEFVLRYLSVENGNLKNKETYYKNITEICKIIQKYINDVNKNEEFLNTIKIFQNKIENMRFYYQKKHEKKDILTWNKEGIEKVLNYNEGNIKPNMLFFDIFIDQPGETKIYELSTKKAFYNILKKDVNELEKFANYNFDKFKNTLDDVRGISDEQLFTVLKEQKDKAFVYWDYFGQFVSEGRIPVSELTKRLNALEKWKITDNITNPEVASKIRTYRDLKPPLVEISSNSAGIGAAMVEPDIDGKLRKMPLLIKFYDERRDKKRKNQPIMTQPEFYMTIDLVLAMDYFQVDKKDIKITLGEKAVLKNAIIPTKIKIKHYYKDIKGTPKEKGPYYFSYNDIKKYFSDAENFPEFTTIKVIHPEKSEEDPNKITLVEDLSTTLSKLKSIEKSQDLIKEINYIENNNAKVIRQLENKLIRVEYGVLSFKADEFENIISSMFGDSDLDSVNVVFNHIEKKNNENILVEDGRASIAKILENTDPDFGFLDFNTGLERIYFENNGKEVSIENLEETYAEISRGNGQTTTLTVRELIDVLSSSVDFNRMEFSEKEEKTTTAIYSSPLYTLLKNNNNFKSISINDYEKGDVQFKEEELNDIDVTIKKLDRESFSFNANELNKVFITEPEIMIPGPIVKDVKIPIDNEGKFIINFQGKPQKTFETEPIYTLYPEPTILTHGDPDRKNWEKYKNRVLLSGIYSSAGINTEGKKDTFQTPNGNMFGIEVHANALYSIFNEEFIISLPGWGSFLIQLGILILLVIILPRISILKGAVIEIILFIVILFIEIWLLFDIFKLNIPIFPQLFIAFYGFIGLTVIKLLSEEREKRQIRSVFSTYVNAEVVNELLKDPENALQLGGASKTITCFFSDIRGFTTLSEELKKVSETELVNRMNEYFTIMTDIVLKYKGTLDKYMGDAIMAFWGAPIEYDKHALLACKTAIEMIEQLPSLKARWPENLRDFDIGIGINTGLAVAGNTGSELRKDYTILGDTVNLGSRLEGVNKTYKTRIIISEYTYEEVKDYVIVRELDLIRVKGKSEPVRIFELVGLNEAGENYQIGDIKINIPQ